MESGFPRFSMVNSYVSPQNRSKFQLIYHLDILHPAFVIGRRWDLLTWNCAAGWLFHFEEPCPPYSRNAVWRFFHMVY